MFKDQGLPMFGLKLNKYEVVVCGNETQLKQGENLNKII